MLIIIFKKGDREYPANYRGITLLSIVGKVFCKILNNRLVQCLDKEGALHEGQAGFRINRSYMDNVYTLNEMEHQERKNFHVTPDTKMSASKSAFCVLV